MRVGTRGSALALAQARWVAEQLDEDAEIVTVTTAGDRGADREDKSRWVSALERALIEGQIDVAVHSAKDVPAELAPTLELVAIPRRADPRDAICGAGALEELPPGARIGTSSLRRAAQIRALRDDLEVVQLRGNVDTRLRKLAEGAVDAVVLAVAGLRRLGHEPDGILETLVPAAGQGALAVEAVKGKLDRRRLAALTDPEATACVREERTLTRELEASCNTPVGAWARVRAEDGGAPGKARERELELSAWVGRADGSAWLSDRVIGPPGEVGRACAQRMLAAGARELLRAS